MGGSRVRSWLVVFVVGGWVVGGVAGRDEAEACYGPGSVVGAVVGTLIVTAGLLASVFFLYKTYWKNRKGKHLVLMSDAENPHDQYAFDNPCFREATPMKHVREEKEGSKVERSKWGGWPPVQTFGKQHRSGRGSSMDDSCVKDPRLRAVRLKSHDFTGLGFNICGNMRDGIFVKDVLHRGPAFESGCMNTGDRIDSVCISFRNMVFEDALTILSYASPYDVQVQVENDSCSRPSTLMRSKRESNAVNCSERILHPKFSRSQSASQLKEMGSSNGKKMGQQAVNHSQDSAEYPSMKVSSPGNKAKSQRTPPMVESKESPRAESRKREAEPRQTKSPDAQNKLHKFGIKVLPISINPKVGGQPVTGSKRGGSETSPGKGKEPSRNASPVDDKLSAGEEVEANKENVKALLAKGFLSLKEKMNQNSLGRKRRGEEEGDGDGDGVEEEEEVVGGGECPVARRRTSVTCGVKVRESEMKVPEEVFRAGDVARSHRKSGVEGRKGEGESEGEGVGTGKRVEEGGGGSESEGSSDREWTKDETKRPKRSKGKAPSPPKSAATSKEMNEIKSETELVLKDDKRIFEPETKVIPLKDEVEPEERVHPNYDSDSDAEPEVTPKDGTGTKIELNATQVTVHHSPAPDANDDDMEPGRKAASLGDLSRLDSEQPLSIVLERAVSLDLTEGTSQSAKKRKAPLPPSEEFPAVFDDLGYRKEPRLEGLSTFQRRLKKSSDFGTLEDALYDDPKPLELASHDLSEAHSHNIQEFSSWLAECRRPKAPEDDAPPPPLVQDNPKITSTSFININSADRSEDDNATDDKYGFQGGNVSFRVNGPDPTQNNIPSPPPPTSRTVVVISQPNSLEPPILDDPPPLPDSPHHQTTDNGPDDPTHNAPPKLPTTPIPTATNTLSSPLSSPLTYVTEIKVSTPQHNSHPDPDPDPNPNPYAPNSVADRIHTFDSLKSLHPPFPKTLTEASKIPIRTMKSETGQRVLATIQSLAKESSSSSSSPKRLPDLFSTNPHTNQPTSDPIQLLQTDSPPSSNVSGLYLKPSSRKVPPLVPPRKIDTSLPARSTLTPTTPTTPDPNTLVTFSSFATRTRRDDPALPSNISFNVKGAQPPPKGELNGRQHPLLPLNTSATNIVLDGHHPDHSL